MSRRKRYLTCSRKYDLPLYCAAWMGAAVERKDDEAEAPGGAAYVVFGGGGGDRKSGLMNRVLLARYDFATDELSEAVNSLSTDDELPYRMAVHPATKDIVYSVTKDCRLIELKSNEVLESSEKVLQPLLDVGEQNCLSFSTDGTRFATGGEDGHLRVFEWPSLKAILDQPRAHPSLKDLDFSLDSSLLASSGGSGPCRVWDILSGTPVASLSADKGANVGFCRFSRDGTRSVLFVTLMKAGKGFIGSWETTTWKKVGTKKLSDVPISALSISPDGKFLAIGSAEGDVSVVDAKRLVVTQRLKSAHMVFVTAMEFSPNSKALLSVSGDSSARVTVITESPTQEGWRLYVLLFILLLFSGWLYVALNDSNGEKSFKDVVHDVMARIRPSNSFLRT